MTSGGGPREIAAEETHRLIAEGTLRRSDDEPIALVAFAFGLWWLWLDKSERRRPSPARTLDGAMIHALTHWAGARAMILDHTDGRRRTMTRHRATELGACGGWQ